MEPSLDSILQRLDELEDRMDEGVPVNVEMMQQMAAQMGTQGAAGTMMQPAARGRSGAGSAAGSHSQGTARRFKPHPPGLGENYPGTGRIYPAKLSRYGAGTQWRQLPVYCIF